MLITHHGRRLVALTTICASLALGTAGPLAAYPITPEGEPLHLEAGRTPTLPASASATSHGPGAATSTPANVVPHTEVSSNGTDWPKTALMVMASMALLALVVAALTLTGHLRGSARSH